MNTNNKEAIDKLKIAKSLVHEGGNDVIAYEYICGVIALLQDNEDTEVEDIAVKDKHTCSNRSECCPKCCAVDHKPSSKVEKLKELQGRFSTNLDYGAQWADLVKILNVLIEDEE